MGVWTPKLSKFRSKNPELFAYLQDKLPNDGTSERMPLNSTILLETLQYQIADESILEKATELRKLERNARNTTAHEIVSMTDAWLQNRVGYSAKQVMVLYAASLHGNQSRDMGFL